MVPREAQLINYLLPKHGKSTGSKFGTGEDFEDLTLQFSAERSVAGTVLYEKTPKGKKKKKRDKGRKKGRKEGGKEEASENTGSFASLNFLFHLSFLIRCH